MLGHIVGFIATPRTQWQKLGDDASSFRGLVYAMLLAILPAAAFYYGVTQVGWQVADGDTVRLTTQSAWVLIGLFYLAMIAAIVSIGYFVHWMACNYGSESTIMKGVSIVAYCATPMFLAGLVGFYPVLWLDMLVAVVAVSWSVYLLYMGIPIVMGIPSEQGFLFASAILAVCLVVLISMMGVTVALWDMGFTPVFSD